jgi:arylsulfatase A-like enzyme
MSDALVGLQDVLPTFATAAGADIGQPVQGKDLSDHLANTSAPVRDVYYSTTQTGAGGQSAMVTDGQWKYIYTEGNATEELYDQVNDLQELHNLAHSPEHKSRLADMRDLLRQCAIDLNDPGILDGDGFSKTKVDRAKFADAPVGGMGWRWY